jgi:hypothetical protein
LFLITPKRGSSASISEIAIFSSMRALDAHGTVVHFEARAHNLSFKIAHLAARSPI